MLYQDASEFLDAGSGTLRNRIYKKIKKEAQAKQIYALVSQTLKFREPLQNVLKNSGMLKTERKLKQGVALLMLHDLLLSKSKRLACSKCYEKDAVLRHKTRLNAELVKYKIKHGLSEAVIDGTPVRWIRVNSHRAVPSDLEKVFVNEGLEQITTIDLRPGTWYKDSHVDGLYGVHPSYPVSKMDMYKTGKIIIQDRASCFPVQMLSPDPSKSYIDACAAPGNKTTQLAAGSAHVDAFERDKKRGGVLQKMVGIAGLNKKIKLNIQDFTTADPAAFDIAGLVVDPSCSGSGIFGRSSLGDGEQEEQRDDSPERLSKLSEFQYIIMSHALSFDAEAVVYSTCSIHVQENEQVVRRLLATPAIGARWKLRPRERSLPEWPRRGLVEEFSGLENAAEMADACVRANPREDGGIGFFAACFERKN